MYKEHYQKFVSSGDSLWVFHGDKHVFYSSDKMLLPMLRYLKEFEGFEGEIIIFDKIIGNAAALLMVIAKCVEAYSPLASKLALATLDAYGIKYHVDTIVPVIQRVGTDEICPMEKLSTGKKPEELYELLKGLA